MQNKLDNQNHHSELDQLPNLLETINFDNTTLDFVLSAEDWKYESDKIFKQILGKIFQSGAELAEEREDEIRTTFEELILNSFIACNERADLKISLTTYFGANGIVVHIIDEGPGFDHLKVVEKSKLNQLGLTREKVLYPNSKEDLPGGTGIFCLLNFSQNFQFNQKGNELAVQFNF